MTTIDHDFVSLQWAGCFVQEQLPHQDEQNWTNSHIDQVQLDRFQRRCQPSAIHYLKVNTCWLHQLFVTRQIWSLLSTWKPLVSERAGPVCSRYWESLPHIMEQRWLTDSKNLFVDEDPVEGPETLCPDSKKWCMESFTSKMDFALMLPPASCHTLTTYYPEFFHLCYRHGMRQMECLKLRWLFATSRRAL